MEIKDIQTKKPVNLLNLILSDTAHYRTLFSLVHQRRSFYKNNLPTDKQKYVEGDYLRLVHLLVDPTNYIREPRKMSWTLNFPTEMLKDSEDPLTRVLADMGSIPLPVTGDPTGFIMFMPFPSIGHLHVNEFFKNIVDLVKAASYKDVKATRNIINKFTKNLWKTNFFEFNPKQHEVLETIEKLYDSGYFDMPENQKKEKISQEELNLKLRNLDLRIQQKQKKQWNKIKNNPRRLLKKFEEVHANIKKLFEIYALFVGKILAITDIIEETQEADSDIYFNKQRNVGYGIINYKGPSTINRSGHAPLIQRLENFKQLRYYLHEILFQNIRLIRNCDGHCTATTPQPHIEDNLYIIDDKRDYRHIFSLGHLILLQENLFTILNMVFNIPFYQIPLENLGLFMKQNLEFLLYNPGYNFIENI